MARAARAIAQLGLAVTMVAPAIAVAGEAADEAATAAAPGTDRALERRVRDELERACDLPEVAVAVDGGTVVLTGKVATVSERLRAESVARAAGAPQVDDRLDVDLAGALAARIDGASAARCSW